MATITIETLQKMHPHDLSELFLKWDDQERQHWMIHLSDETLAEMLSYLEPETAAEVIITLKLDRQTELINFMEPDDATDILLEMDANHQQAILEMLDSQSTIIQLLKYDEEETGAYMTTRLVSLRPTMDVKEATAKVIGQANKVETINRLFVVDDNNRFLGAVSLKALIKSRSPLNIESITETYPTVLDSNPIEESIHKMNDYSTFEMPVCNQEGQLLGMIMMDDALETYHEEATEDYEKLSALPETEEEHYLQSALKRLPWLIALLALSIPIAYITTLFEEILVAVAVLAFFQPLILDAAGDVATQTLAVTLRALSKNPETALKNGVKEVLSGIITGFIMGVTAFIIAYFLAVSMGSDQPWMLAWVVGLSLWLTVIISPVLGVLIPVTVDRVGFDPAVASGPFITTLSDLISLLLFFGLATLLLGGL